uniref:Uncharacterized protein n=1 Tax=Meloidogyne enterolobii TaxID=390850 RepID=A0A6V7XU26_MELEN|nr:unnamed protein product [Meloidogyne enterolobii]
MDLLQQNDILQQPGPSNLNEPKISKNRRTFVNDRNRELSCGDSRKQKRKKGHLRGTRSNGFASGPPFPKFADVQKRRLSRNSETDDYYFCDDYPWGAPLNEQQKKQQMALIEHEINEMANETLCGLGHWRPQWLQRFARREWMLILMCWFCLIQGMIVSGLVPSSISTIERRFQFSTSVIGRILQFYEFGYVLFCIPVSYFGGRHSKSTVLGIGLLIMSVSQTKIPKWIV